VERLEPRFGPLGREYRRITFDKRNLAEDPTEMCIRQPIIFLDLIPADANSQPSLARTEDAYFAVDRGQIEEFLLEQGLQPLLQDVQKQRQRELDTIARHVDVSLLTLIDRQQRQAADLLQRQQHGEDVALALGEVERRLDELNARPERRCQELQRER